MATETKYTAYIASSIDGRIAKNGKSGADWTSKEDQIFFQAELKKYDAVIVGRNTFKVAEEQLKKRKTIVLTSKVSRPKTTGSVTFLNPQKENLRKYIEAKNYKKVAVLGGSRVYAFCLEREMLDQIFVTVEPYIFTAGVPMFQGGEFRKFRFSLASIKKMNKKGTILLHYKNED